jgi:O-antigen/teichoic acid export membrane protein
VAEQPESVSIIPPVDVSLTGDKSILGVAKGGGVTLVGKTFTNIGKFITAFLLARLLGATAYGTYQLALNVVTLLAGLVVLGLDTALMRFIAISVSRQNERRTWGTIQIGIGLPVLLGSIVGVGMFALSYPVATQVFHDAKVAPLLQVASVIVPLSVMGDTLIGAIRGFKNMEYPVYAKFIIQPIFKLILIGVASFLGLNAIRATMIFGVGELIAALMLIYYLNKLFKLKRSWSAAQRDLKGILIFSLPDWLAGVMDTFRGNIQSILIGSLSSIAGVGIFTVADQLNVIGHDFYSSINTSAKPYIAELHDRGDRVQLERLYQVTAKWALTVDLPFFLILVLFPVQILSVFGKSFEGGATALIIMALASLIDVATGMCGAVINMTGYTGLKLFNNVLSLVLSVILNVILIPRWGIVGAAVSALVIMALLNLIRIVQVYVLMRIVPYNSAFLKPLAAGLLAFLFGYFLKQRFSFESGILHLAVHTGILCIVFVGAIWTLGLSAEDHLLWSRIRSRIFGYFSRK